MTLTRVLRRALTATTLALSVAAAQGMVAPAAHAASSFTCPHDASTRIVTATVLNEDYQLWLWQPDPRTVHVCFSLGPAALIEPRLLAGDLILRTPFSGSLVPTVTPVLADESCPDLLNVQDPVPLVVEGGTPGGDVCIGLGDNEAVRVAFTTPVPTTDVSVELWLDGGTIGSFLWCFPGDPIGCPDQDHYIKLV